MKPIGPAELERMHRRALRALRRRQGERPRWFAAETRLVAGAVLGLLVLWPGGVATLAGVGLVAALFRWGERRPGTGLEPGLLLGLTAAGTGLYWAWTLWRTVRSVRPSEGIELRPADAPGLHEALGELRRELGAGAFCGVLVQVMDGASVERLPLLGPLGPARRRLAFGPPLLATLSPAQARAVLAHEIAHTLPGSGLPPAWVVWTAAASAARAGQAGAGVWFQKRVIRLHARVRAGSLAAEAYADSRSGEATSPAVAAAMLTRVAQLGAWLNRVHWPAVNRLRGVRAVPPSDGFSGLLRRLRAGDAEDPAPLADALRDHTGQADSHPSLLDRLANVGAAGSAAPPAGPEREAAIARVASAYPPRPEVSAWEAWLTPDARDRVLAVCDRVFQEGSRGVWEAAHGAVQHARDGLAADRELLGRLEPGDPPRLDVPAELPVAEADALARSDADASEPFRLEGPLSADRRDLDRTADLVGHAAPGGAAEPALRWLLEEDPGLAAGWFHLGRALAERDDEASGREAVACFERAADLPTRRTHPARAAAHEKLRALGEPERAERALERHEHLAVVAEELDLALRKPPAAASLAPPDVSALCRARIRRQLAAFPSITGAWLCSLPELRRAELPGVVQHALFYRVKTPWHRLENEHRHAHEQAALQGLLDFHAPLAVWNLNVPAKKLRRAVERVEGALLHRGAG